MRNKLLLFLVAIVTLLAGYFFAMRQDNQNAENKPTPSDSQSSSSSISAQNQSNPASSASSSSSSSSISSISMNRAVKLDVPFVVQAPFANWSDPVFQNACEEASMIMAMGWVNGDKDITPAETKKKIEDIVAFENKAFGFDADTDVFDMEKVFENYFHYGKTEARKNISLDDIKKEIAAGNLVLVPTFGQALHNPNYTAPGPIVHMLTIIGYDPAAKEFITNDPGTKRGAGYRYDENVLFKAVWGYPSGKDIPPKPDVQMEKDMLTVSK